MTMAQRRSLEGVLKLLAYRLPEAYVEYREQLVGDAPRGRRCALNRLIRALEGAGDTLHQQKLEKAPWADWSTLLKSCLELRAAATWIRDGGDVVDGWLQQRLETAEKLLAGLPKR